MGNWKDDKDLGAWAFTEQEDKFGYLNNARWSTRPKGAADSMSASEFCEGKGIALDPIHTHKPCGHWHKRREITAPQPNLYGTGENDYGQIGLEDGTSGYDEYFQVMTDSAFTQIACGLYHSIVLKSDGTLWVTGRNKEGQLGLGDNNYRFEWEQAGSDSDWSYVACGCHNSFAIKADGSLYATGSNKDYQLGLGDDTDRDVFTQVGSDTDWIQVDAGYRHMVCLKSTGILWGSGYNNDGELGLGNSLEYATTLTQLPVTGWTQISCGDYETMGIRSGNTLWGTGYNSSAMLGLGHNNEVYTFTQISGTDWERVECGLFHSMAIKTSGTLWASGENYYGQLGLTDDVSTVENYTQVGSEINWEKVYCGLDRSAAINTSEELWICGITPNGEAGIGVYYFWMYGLVQVPGTWIDICNNGNHHTAAIKSDGTLYVSGSNKWGAIGTEYGNHIDTLTLVNHDIWLAVDCWEDHTLAIRSDGALWGTGYCYFGELGFGNNCGYLRYRFKRLPVGDGWEQVATGGNHSIIFKDGQIWGAGYNYYGQLGLNNTTMKIREFTQLSGTDWVFIAAGANCTMAINTSGELFSTGSNSGGNYGQLGLDDAFNRKVLTQCIGTGWKQVSVGGCHAAAVRDDGTLWTTGKNASGQLGLGDNTQRIIWTQVAGTDWDYVECGYNFTLAVDINGNLYGTGSNLVGELGLNDLVNRNSFTLISSGWLHDSYNGLAQFGGGAIHSLAIYGNNILYASGDNYYGQLGLGCSGYEAVQDGGAAADEDRDEFEQTAESIPVDGATDTWDFVVCGSHHTMALKIVEGITGYNDDNEPQVWPM